MVSWIIHLQPGGTSGVLLKSNWLQIWAKDDSFGLIIEFLIRLIVMFACGINAYQIIIGKGGSVPLTPTIRWFLCVWMAHSTRFFLWLCGGTSYTASPWFFNMFKWSSLTSLNSRRLVGSYHFWFTWSSSFSVASCSVSVFLFGIGSSSITFSS